MKLALVIAFMSVATAAQAHQTKNAGCKAIHDACTEAKLTGKANMKCAHDIMDGKKVDAVTKDLTASIKDCKSAKDLHEMHEHEAAPDMPTPESK